MDKGGLVSFSTPAVPVMALVNVKSEPMSQRGEPIFRGIPPGARAQRRVPDEVPTLKRGFRTIPAHTAQAGVFFTHPDSTQCGAPGEAAGGGKNRLGPLRGE